MIFNKKAYFYMQKIRLDKYKKANMAIDTKGMTKSLNANNILKRTYYEATIINRSKTHT